MKPEMSAPRKSPNNMRRNAGEDFLMQLQGQKDHGKSPSPDAGRDVNRQVCEDVGRTVK